ncbi:hypothetical protein JODPKFFF_00138 [Ostreid herpesvirus 1]|nr:hypothetical protein JODPKFFF_00004 [Ostreid herpesvirus 1]UPX73438.1 hypothetical protein JODPKFFF_00138 [Ostreid herpesvirus 1]
MVFLYIQICQVYTLARVLLLYSLPPITKNYQGRATCNINTKSALSVRTQAFNSPPAHIRTT